MLSLKKLCQGMEHNYIGKDIPFSGASIDTRKLHDKDLFVACQGEQVDGHDYIALAKAHGAVALMVNRPVNSPLPQVVVHDTVKALAHLAKNHRAQFDIPIIALTGSCGKTGTKNIIAHLLSHQRSVLATEGNLNNQLGAPLTLLRLKSHHQCAVLELGTSSRGEIASLCELTQPTVSLITNIRAQHLEGIGTLEDVAIEKSAIFSCLHGDNHLALINRDDPHIHRMVSALKCPHLSFSRKGQADVYVKKMSHNKQGGLEALLSVRGITHTVSVPLRGEHIIDNILAAISACLALNVHIDEISKAFGSLAPVKGRFYPYTLKEGTLVIDDTYNASTASVASAISTLDQHPGKRVFVMSNMSELGQEAKQHHANMGRLCQQSDIEHIFLTGDKALLSETLKNCQTKAKYFDTKRELTDHLAAVIDEGTMVVVKGSRANTMEEIVNALLEQDKLSTHI